MTCNRRGIGLAFLELYMQIFTLNGINRVNMATQLHVHVNENSPVRVHSTLHTCTCTCMHKFTCTCTCNNYIHHLNNDHQARSLCNADKLL